MLPASQPPSPLDTDGFRYRRAIMCFFKISSLPPPFLFSRSSNHLFQVSGIWGHEGIHSTLGKEALFGCSVSTICSFCSGYLESHLLLHLPCHLSSGPAPGSSVPLPCAAEQMLSWSRLHFCELQDGPCRCLVHEFSACQML